MGFNINEDNVEFTSKVLYPTKSNKGTFWSPTPSMLKDIMNYLFAPDNRIFEDFGKLLFNADPQKALISLRVYPIDFGVVGSPWVDMLTTTDFKIMNRGIPTDSNPYRVQKIDETKLGRLNDFGYVDIPYLYDSDNFFNYDPYSKIYLYLPFAPLTALDTKRVVGTRIYVQGVIDFYAGDIHYFISYSTDEGVTKTFLDEVTAHIAVDIPIYRSNYFDTQSTIMKNAISGITNAGFGALAGNPSMIVKAGAGVVNDSLNMRLQNHLQNNGSMGAMGGFYEPLKPHLIRYVPRTKYDFDDTHYNHLYGVPCKKIDKLSTFGGFTKVGGIHIKEIPNATTEEINEIETLLKQGVILDNSSAIFGITYRYDSTQATFSNVQVSVPFGATYTTNVSAVSGYLIDSIQVFMGNQDITSTAVTGNTISVANVSGNLTIRVITSAIPRVFDVIYNQLVGVTLSNPAVTIEEGETYETNLIPQYSLGYILSAFNYSPIVLQGNVYLPSAYANGTIRVTNVSDNIEIRGNFPQVTTMTNQWLYNGDFMSLPTEPIDLSNKVVNFDDGNTQYTGNDIIIDNQETHEGYFISFTTATSDFVAIDRNGNIYVNDVLTSHLVNIDFYMPSEYYTSYTGLLPWLDNNFHINFTP